MKASTLTAKLIKKQYGKFSLSKGTCQCWEICIGRLAQEWAKQVDESGWQIDLDCKSALDVQLYKIGKRLLKGAC